MYFHIFFNLNNLDIKYTHKSGIPNAIFNLILSVLFGNLNNNLIFFTISLVTSSACYDKEPSTNAGEIANCKEAGEGVCYEYVCGFAVSSN